MQLFDRILNHNKKKPQQQEDNDTIASSTSTVNKKKRGFSFSKLCWIYSNSRRQQQQEQEFIDKESCVATENQVLLTQCIETALFNNSNSSPPSITNSIINNSKNKRWSLIENKSINFVDIQPIPYHQQRRRKLSLPAQYSNIGYLASIPEVDSFTE